MKRCLLALLIAMTCPISQADSDPVAKVDVSDIDMNSEAGVNTLYERMRDAAKSACSKDTRSDLGGLQYLSRCIEDAVDRAVTEINHPMLTQRHQNNGA
jgi:UrcA family protein